MWSGTWARPRCARSWTPLNPAAAKPRAYTTYMTILGRLHTKGLLDRRREGKTDYYRPVHTRAEYADLRAQARWRTSSTPTATWRSAISRARWPIWTPSAAERSSASPVSAERRTQGLGSWGLYRLQLGLGAAGLGACALVLAAGVSSVHVRPDAAHRLDVAGVGLTYPAVNAAALALLALAALGAAVLIVTARAAWRQIRAHRRFIRALPVRGPLAEHPTVLVVDAAAPLAFCAGWLRPRVYVSTGVLERPLGARAARRPRARAAPRRAARPAPPGGQPRAVPGAVLPPGPPSAARSLRRRGRARRRRGGARGKRRRHRTAGLGHARVRQPRRAATWSASRPSGSTRCSAGRRPGGCPGCC